MNPWLAGGTLLALLHAGLPWLFHQRLGLAVASRVRAGRGDLALTFDDGPDPKTTPAVLEALAEHGVRATFFLLHERARKHPDLVRALVASGHEVALHGGIHRHAWLKNPLRLYGELAEAKQALEGLAGTPVRHYRPPHGGWTWPLLLATRRLGLVPVQWEVEAGDWVPGASPKAVAAKVLARVRPGSIVVMHDAGRGGEVAANALPRLLPALLSAGYRPAPLAELHPVVAGLGELGPKLLAPVEAVFARVYRVEPAFYGAHSVFRLAPAPLPVDLPGLPRGTPGAEIHMDSERMRRAGEAGSLAAFRAARASMADLARAAVENPRFAGVKVFFGTSLFWEVLAPLGFESAPLPPGYARRVGLWMYLLHRAYGGRPLKRVEARLVYLTRDALLRRYREPRADEGDAHRHPEDLGEG